MRNGVTNGFWIFIIFILIVLVLVRFVVAVVLIVLCATEALDANHKDAILRCYIRLRSEEKEMKVSHGPS